MDWAVVSLVLGVGASLASLLEYLRSRRGFRSGSPRFDQAIIIDIRNSTADASRGIALVETVAKAVRGVLARTSRTSARQHVVVGTGDGFVIGLFDAVPTAALDLAAAVREGLGDEAGRVAIVVERSPLERIGTWGVAGPLLRLAATAARKGEPGLWLSENYLEKAQVDGAWGSRQLSDRTLAAGGPDGTHNYRELTRG